MRTRRYSVARGSSPGRVIREARRARGLTQAGAAARAGTNPKHWSSLERDEGSPSIVTMERIAAALGMAFRYELVDLRDELDQQAQHRSH